MKVLLLGKGYIGNYLAKTVPNQFEVKQISKNDLDYSDPQVFYDHLLKNKYEWIINSSGYTGKPNVDACEDDKANCYHYNVTVPLFLTKIANKLRIPIIHIGSGCIYSGYDKAYSEEDSANFGADSWNSSFYSKTKDAFEKLSENMNRYVFRIRIPFNGIEESKNYFYKLLNYDNLISCKNSITNVDELVDFTYKFVLQKPEYGVYNVTNSGSITAREIVELMQKYNLNNPNWKFVSIDEAKFRVGRSNCVLLTDKIESLGLKLSNVYQSVEKAVKQYSESVDKL